MKFLPLTALPQELILQLVPRRQIRTWHEQGNYHNLSQLLHTDAICPLYPIHTNITAGSLYSMLFLSCNFLVHCFLKRHTNVTTFTLLPRKSPPATLLLAPCPRASSACAPRLRPPEAAPEIGYQCATRSRKPQRGPGVFRPPASRVRRKLRLVATRRTDRPEGAAGGCGSAHAARSGPPQHHPAANRIDSASKY